jgi:hypothetical protein
MSATDLCEPTAAALVWVLRGPLAMSNFSCPRHPEVQSDRPSTCSKCGTKLEQRDDRSTTGARPRKDDQKREP